MTRFKIETTFFFSLLLYFSTLSSMSARQSLSYFFHLHNVLAGEKVAMLNICLARELKKLVQKHQCK